MQIEDYQAAAATTAIYKDKLVYPALGLASESGELIAKMVDGSAPVDIAKEIGDVLWYVAAVATDAYLILVNCANTFEVEASYFASFEGLRTFGCIFPNENLAEEVGKVCGYIKKTLRDDGGVLSHDRKRALAQALGMILALLSDFAKECDTTLDEVAQGNLDKLASRAERGTITGDGDNR